MGTVYLDDFEPLELMPIMTTPRAFHATSPDTGFEDSVHPCQSMLFEGTDFAQLPSPQLSPLLEMSDLPVPQWPGL